MNLLKLLEGIRTPILDKLFGIITYLGDEIAFLALAIIFYWCVSKRRGLYIMTVGLFGTVINQVLKLTFRIDRPWVKDPTFKPVESAVERATGYSFPSGHTQNATGTFGTIGVMSKGWGGRILAILCILLVAFSRMYLGVHTPLDVFTSLGIGIAITALLYPVFKSDENTDRFMPIITIVGMFLSLLFILYFPIFGNDFAPTDTNYQSGLKNAYTMAGCTIGLTLIYFFDKRYIKFDTGANWYTQIIKTLLGLGITLLLKETLRTPLEFVCGGNELIARMLRYLIVVLFAGAVWPLTFKYFTRIRISALDRFGEWVSHLFKRKNEDEPTDDEEADEEKPKPERKRIITLPDGSEVYNPKKPKKPSWRKANKRTKRRYK